MFSRAFHSMRRGFDVCEFHSQVLRLPDSKGFISKFRFGVMLGISTDSVVVLIDRDN